MATDDLDPCVARLSAAMALAMLDKQAFDVHEEGFEIYMVSHCWEMIKDVSMVFVLPKINFAVKSLTHSSPSGGRWNNFNPNMD